MPSISFQVLRLRLDHALHANNDLWRGYMTQANRAASATQCYNKQSLVRTKECEDPGSGSVLGHVKILDVTVGSGGRGVWVSSLNNPASSTNSLPLPLKGQNNYEAKALYYQVNRPNNELREIWSVWCVLKIPIDAWFIADGMLDVRNTASQRWPQTYIPKLFPVLGEWRVSFISRGSSGTTVSACHG